VLRTAPRIGISILAAHQESVSRQLATRGADLVWRVTRDGAVLISDASAWFETSLEKEITAGDHTIVVLNVHNLGSDPDIAPLVFHASAYRHLHFEDGQ